MSSVKRPSICEKWEFVLSPNSPSRERFGAISEGFLENARGIANSVLPNEITI
jgi:hypothetical protein